MDTFLEGFTGTNKESEFFIKPKHIKELEFVEMKIE